MDILWETVCGTTRGHLHKEHGLPNQDAYRQGPNHQLGSPVVAVADGHGDPRAFRSQIGSRFACSVAVELLSEIVAASHSDPQNIKGPVQDRLPKNLHQRWREAVMAHFGQSPFAPAEMSTAIEKYGEDVLRKLESNPFRAYGTTLLAVAVHPEFILTLQIGDGDLLVVGSNGAVARPIAADPRLIANETTSLSSGDAWKDIRVSYQRITNSPPALLLACTDGYSNAFRESDLEAVAVEWVAAIQTDGVEEVRDYLPESLAEASMRGSGDDTTLAMIYRTNTDPAAFAAVADALNAEPETPNLVDETEAPELPTGTSAPSDELDTNHQEEPECSE